MDDLAPIALFAYNRPIHFEKTLNALKANVLAEKSSLYIYCDYGPESEYKNIETVREIASHTTGFKDVILKFSDINKGLAKSIISGVSELVKLQGKVIVLEDDLLTSPYFLEYMNKGLSLFEHNENISMVHGHFFNIPCNQDYFLLRKMGSWGWGTWKRSWQEINFDAKELRFQLAESGKITEFNINGSYNFSKMLQNFIDGNNNSWAIRAYASLFLKNRLSLYPTKSYVQHIGFDSGTHYSNILAKPSAFDGEITATEVPEFNDLPIEENKEMFFKLADYYRKNKPSFFDKLIIKFSELLNK